MILDETTRQRRLEGRTHGKRAGRMVESGNLRREDECGGARVKIMCGENQQSSDTYIHTQ